MLNLKKLIASVCAITVALSTVAFASSYSDVTEDSAYYEAVETLSKLNIVTGYEDGTYKPEETVTRAEMAALIARIQGFDETAKGNANTIFTDVPYEYWASGYIAQATNQGILNGYGDGTFGPDDQVTYEQAVKMIMATLGFTPFAENNGGYPTGYLTAATRYNVNKGVSNAVVGTGANRGTIAQLLNNAIDTPLMAQYSWNTNGEIEYAVYDGSDKVDRAYRTLMSEYLGVVKLKGVVKSNSIVDVQSTKSIQTDKDAEVVVYVTDNFETNHKDFQAENRDYTFLVGESDAEEFIGQAVVLYVVENRDDYEVVSIAADTARNDVVTFTLDQFDYYDAANNRIYYYKNATDSTSTYKTIQTGANNTAVTTVVYNGVIKDIDDVLSAKGATDKYVAAGGVSKLGGEITLIDNDIYAGYDIVFVDIAATAVVDEVGDEVVAFKADAEWLDNSDSAYMTLGSELEFESDVDDTIIVLTKDGEEIEYTDLKEWDVLSIITGREDNKGYINVEVISNPVTGTITASSKSKTSVGGTAYTIDGKKYDVASGGYKTDNLAVGDSGTFYINKYGKIAAFNEDTSVGGLAGNYAYILKMVGDDNSLGDKALTFQLLTAEGVKVIDAASTIKVNYTNDQTVSLKVSDMVFKKADGTNAGADDVVDGAVTAAKFFDGYGVAKGDVVKYTKNSAGYVNAITTATHDTDRFSLTTTYNVAVGTEDQEYDADNGKLGKFIDADATVFFVDEASTDKSVVGTTADLSDRTSYNVKAIYADNKADDNNIVVILGGINNAAPSTNVAIITSIAQSTDDNGADILTLSYVQDGAEVTDVETIEDIEGNVGSTLTVGDVVKLKTNAAGKITTINKVIDFADGGRIVGQNVEGTIATPVDASLETYTGGAVAWAKKGGYISFKEANSALGTTAGSGYVPAESLASTDLIRLSKADNIYVVDFTGKDISVKNGTASSFRFFEKMYTTADSSYSIYADDSTTGVAIDGKVSTLAPYTDHVYLRYYDGELTEAIIVKCPLDVKVKNTPATPGTSGTPATPGTSGTPATPVTPTP